MKSVMLFGLDQKKNVADNLAWPAANGILQNTMKTERLNLVIEHCVGKTDDNSRHLNKKTEKDTNVRDTG